MPTFVKCTHFESREPVYVNLDTVLWFDPHGPTQNVRFTFGDGTTLTVSETPEQTLQQIPS